MDSGAVSLGGFFSFSRSLRVRCEIASLQGRNHLQNGGFRRVERAGHIRHLVRVVIHKRDRAAKKLSEVAIGIEAHREAHGYYCTNVTNKLHRCNPYPHGEDDARPLGAGMCDVYSREWGARMSSPISRWAVPRAVSVRGGRKA